MISYEALKNLTDADIAELEKLRAIAAEAEEAEKLIKKVCALKATIWEDEEEGATATLSHDGKWTIEVAGNGCYTSPCDASTIFDHFYAEYVYKEKRPCALADGKVGLMAEVCYYFRKFLKQMQEEHDGVAE